MTIKKLRLCRMFGSLDVGSCVGLVCLPKTSLRTGGNILATAAGTAHSKMNLCGDQYASIISSPVTVVLRSQALDEAQAVLATLQGQA